MKNMTPKTYILKNNIRERNDLSEESSINQSTITIGDDRCKSCGRNSTNKTNIKRKIIMFRT